METREAVEQPGDAALVAAASSGDREAFAEIYDRYADRLHDFCWSLLRNREEAADATHDTFVLAAERLAQLRDPERLRPWLYAVARSQALRRLRVRDRMSDSDAERELEAVADGDAGPERSAERAALQRLVWDAASGLSERDRSLLDLHLRHGLEGAELGEAMGVSAGHAYVLLSRVRDQVERSLGALLIARKGSEDCVELARVLEDWDGRFSPLIRKRVARHIDGCEECGDRRKAMVSPLALLAAVPLTPAPLDLRDRVLASATLPGGPGQGPSTGSGSGPSTGPGLRTGVTAAAAAPAPPELPPPPPEPPQGSRVAVLALVVLLALVLGGVAAVLIPTLAASEDGGPTAAPPPATDPPAVTVPATAPPTTAAPVTTTAPTTTVPETTTSSGPTTTAVSIEPVSLRIAPAAVEFGPRVRRVTVSLTNPSPAAVPWEAVASELWLAVEPTGGTIEPGATATVTVAYNPRAVKPPASGSLLITWNGGQAQLPVTLEGAPPTTTTTTTVPTTTTLVRRVRG